MGKITSTPLCLPLSLVVPRVWPRWWWIQYNYDIAAQNGVSSKFLPYQGGEVELLYGY